MNDDDLRQLSAQEELFCVAYGNPESTTYGNATKSAEVARYAQPHNAGWKVKKRPHIRARLQEFYDVAEASIGKVMSDLEHERILALEKGDVAAAIRASELQGKRLGAFTDSASKLDITIKREYSEREKLEAAKIAQMHFLESVTPSKPMSELPGATISPKAGQEGGA